MECLDSFQDNIDDSINLLFDKYFPSKKLTTCELTDEERLMMMEDELESLKSIFSDSNEFIEIEKNHIWQLKMRLDYLLKFSPSEEKKAEKRKQLEMEAHLQELQQMKLSKKKAKAEKCRNVLEKGKCKFGAKCKFSHDVFREENNEADANGIKNQYKKRDESDEDRKIWTIEIRFPKWAKYPAQAPIILLRTKIGDIPKSICLSINQRLIEESRELAKDQIPSVYSIIDLLRNEEQIVSYLKKHHFFRYPSADVSIFDYDPEGLSDDDSSDTEAKAKPTHYQLGKIDKFDKRTLSDAEILKENLNLIRKFQDKQSNSYYKKMIESRKSLPVWASKEEIVSAITSNQIVVVVSSFTFFCLLFSSIYAEI